MSYRYWIDEDSVNTFKYSPLIDSSSEIRLLEILEVDHSITCRLSVWVLGEAPSYHAISYTWGDESTSTSIVVNDKAMTIRSNCEDALRQAYSYGLSQYFWIDAICIDQKSTKEKNHQVSLMGRIYAEAAHVLACIGPHADGSEFLLATMDAQKSLFNRIHRHITISGHGRSKGWNIANPIPKVPELSWRCFFQMDAKSRRKFANALIMFLKRPYFTRLWVLQELHLAKTSSFCCGTEVRPFDQLLAASLLVDFWINQQYYIHNWNRSARKAASIAALPTFISSRQNSCFSLYKAFNELQPQRGCLALTSGARGPRRLAEVLDEMRHFQCADLRDKLYGILSLVEWGDRKMPDPDYAKDRSQVCIMTLELWLEDELLAPRSGTYVDWVRRLNEIFEATLDIHSVRRALQTRAATRPGSSVLPEQIMNASHGMLIDISRRSRSQELAMLRVTCS